MSQVSPSGEPGTVSLHHPIPDQAQSILMSQQASTRRANLSHGQQSKLRADDRRREILREENVKRLTAEKLLEANMASEERVENKRFLCRLQLEARERDMDQALFQVRKRIIFHNYIFFIVGSPK